MPSAASRLAFSDDAAEMSMGGSPQRTATPVRTLPSVARVALTSHGSSVTIIQDILLPRGEWKGEALRFHVAYGAPGPRAMDVRLVPVDDGALCRACHGEGP